MIAKQVEKVDESQLPEFECTFKQSQALHRLRDDVTRQIVFGGGAGGGKSVLGCYWIIKNCWLYPGSRYMIGRAVRKTLYDTTVKTLREVLKMLGFVAGLDYKEHTGQSYLAFRNGSEIVFANLEYVSTDPEFDRLGSLELTGAFIDEAAEIIDKCREVITARIRFKLEGVDCYGKPYKILPKLLMSCNPTKGFLYNLFYKPSREGTLHPMYAFIQSLVKDNRHIPKVYIENLELIQDRPTRERLLHGNWDFEDEEGILMPYEFCLNLFHNSWVPFGFDKYITADIALQGSDKFIILVWSGFVIIDFKVILKSNAKDVENALREVEYRHQVPRSNMIYDSDGVGGFLDAYLEDSVSFRNNATPVYEGAKSNKEEYQNLKSQCYFHAARSVNKGEVWWDIDPGKYKDDILQELSSARNSSLGTDKKLAVQRKEEWKQMLGRSPDFADAFIMRWYFELKGPERYVTSN